MTTLSGRPHTALLVVDGEGMPWGSDDWASLYWRCHRAPGRTAGVALTDAVSFHS